MVPKSRKPNAKMEEDRTEESRKKKAARTTPNDYIYKRKKAKLIHLITDYGRTKLKKPLK
jgi:hypothetical protein